jgi:putative transposase
LLQSDRSASLLIDVLRNYMAAGKFKVHEFIVMPNHFHILLTIDEPMKIEDAVKLIKGNFSYRLSKEFGIRRETWQRGFSDVRITTRESFLKHVDYINSNAIKAGLASAAEEYPYCSVYLRKLKKNLGRSAPA